MSINWQLAVAATTLLVADRMTDVNGSTLPECHLACKILAAGNPSSALNAG